MKSISGIPAFEVEFDKSAKLVDRAQLAALSSHCKDNGVTDLILFAHGWNNDMADARDLYTRLLTEIGKVLAKNPPKGLEGRTFAAGLILWPSKKFTDEDLIPGGAAAVSSNDLTAVQQGKIKKATALLKTIATDEGSQMEFVEVIRSLLSKKTAHPDDGSAKFFQVPGAELLQGFRASVQVTGPNPSGGGAADMSSVGRSAGAAGLIQDMGTSIEAGVRRFLNYTTYYQMKERAGLIGSAGVASMLAQLRKSSPKLRLHLVGHSFGGRVVTAATDAAGPATKVNSLTLLQAAYSHNGLSQKFDGKNDGFFRKVISAKKVMGPILATCTKNDRAVGIAYPLASRISGVNAAALGDENDPYGGIGRNGAVKTPEAVKATLQTEGTAYAFSAGKVFNLNADAVISGHSDICKPEVGWALLSAVATT